MFTTLPSKWAVQGATFVLWAAAAASAVAWGFKLGRPADGGAPQIAGARGPVVPDPAAIARLLGASALPVAGAPAVNVASRFSLVGVAAHPSHSGVALISVDGKPAKPFRVGSAIDEGFVLQSVEGRRATLGPAARGPAALTLELPPLRR